MQYRVKLLSKSIEKTWTFLKFTKSENSKGMSYVLCVFKTWNYHIKKYEPNCTTCSSSWRNSDGISLRMILEKILSPSAILISDHHTHDSLQTNHPSSGGGWGDHKMKFKQNNKQSMFTCCLRVPFFRRICFCLGKSTSKSLPVCEVGWGWGCVLLMIKSSGTVWESKVIC